MWPKPHPRCKVFVDGQYCCKPTKRCRLPEGHFGPHRSAYAEQAPPWLHRNEQRLLRVERSLEAIDREPG